MTNDKQFFRQFSSWLGALACAGLLAACGGGGDDASPEAPATFRMAAETEAQEALLMASPTMEYKQGWSMLAVQAEMIRELIDEVRIVYVVNGEEDRTALLDALAGLGVPAQAVAQRIDFHTVEHADLWVRDYGGLFMVDGRGRTQVVDFDFDGYGYNAFGGTATNEYYDFDNDLSLRVASALGLPADRSTLIAEGGNLHFNGRGTVIATEIAITGRQPHVSREQAEAEIKRVLKQRHMIWVPRSTAADAHTVLQTPYEIAGDEVYNFGVNHIDELVAWVDDRTLLLPEVTEDEVAAAEAAGDPTAAINRQVLEEIATILRASTDQDGRPLTLIRVPEPGPLIVESGPDDMMWQSIADLDFHPVHRLRGAERFAAGEPMRYMLAASYMNFLVANGVVLVPRFFKPGRDPALEAKDEAFRAVIAACYPGRRVVQLDVDALTAGGGGMHCITQHIPRATAG